MTRTTYLLATLLAMVTVQARPVAHDGPPFPIVTDAVRGPYTISIWTDPDATDDGTAGGQFWVVIALSPKSTRLPAETRATVSIRSLTGPPHEDGARAAHRRYGHTVSAVATPVRDDIGNQFAAVLMDHEGPYEVQVTIDGPLGRAAVDSRVDATYDLRPPPYMLAWYLMPFLIAGVLWTRLLLRRRDVSAKR